MPYESRSCALRYSWIDRLRICCWICVCWRRLGCYMIHLSFCFCAISSPSTKSNIICLTLAVCRAEAHCLLERAALLNIFGLITVLEKGVFWQEVKLLRRELCFLSEFLTTRMDPSFQTMDFGSQHLAIPFLTTTALRTWPNQHPSAKPTYGSQR